MTLKLKIIIGSTRPGRAVPPVAQWADDYARQHGGFDVELVDLHELALPLLDEAAHPRFKKYENAHTKRWAAIVDEADAFVFVTPEYDYFPPATLVNAVQYLFSEWAEKPAGIVSYGGVSAGLRATQQLRLLLSNMSVMPLAQSVPLPFFSQFIVDGVFTPNQQTLDGAKIMFERLAHWGKGLKAMRQQAA
jgi:NAD(P)H-dependent FMN reductase